MEDSRTVADRLRAEYFALLPDIRRTLLETETRVRRELLDVSLTLERYERLVIVGRIKECESAVDSLRRRQPFGLFDPAKPEGYSLTALPDLTAVRVMAFPENRGSDARKALEPTLEGWNYDPVRGAAELDVPLALKWFGKWHPNSKISAEVQIVQLLIGSFWEVEHSAIYKPSPNLKGAVLSQSMVEKRDAVFLALREFEREFARVIGLSDRAGSDQ
jgi:hypothetical protein